MRNSIRTRLAIAFVALAAGLLILVGAVLAWQSYVTEQQQALTLESQLAHRISNQVTSYIQAQENALRLLVQVQGLNDLSLDQKTQLLSNLLSYSDAFDKLTLVNRYGQEQVAISRTEANVPLSNRSNADEYKIPKANGQTYYSPVHFAETTGEPLMTIAVPVIDIRSGAVTGVFIADIRFRPIWNLLASIPLGEGGSAYIVDAQGQVIAHNNPSVVLRNTNFAVPGQDGVYPGLNNTNVVLATDRIAFGEQQFTIVSDAPVSEAFASLINTELTIAALLLIGMAIAGGLGLVAARQIVHPIEVLVTTAQTISAGDLSHQAQITSYDEIGTLAKAFNSMTAQLRDLIGTLEQRVADRTKALATSAEVSRRLSTILNERQLIVEVVEQIRTAFDYYHVHIYVVDDRSGDLVMAGGTGDVGASLLGSGHRIPKGRGLVGRAADNNTPVLVSDTSKDPDWLPNPLLPETKSEAAVPIAIGNKVSGVLDVQHNETEGLGQEDIDLLQSIAAQVAVAIQNARSYTEAQQKADREARITTIGQKIQGTTTVEGALQVAVRELGRSLGMNNIRVILEAPGTPAESGRKIS